MELGEIEQWLVKKGTYKEGVALYDAHGTNQALKDLFRKGEVSFTRDKLRKSLEQLLQVNSPSAKPAPFFATFPENRPETDPGKNNSQNNSHPEVNGKLRPLLDERTHLHAQLERMGPEECRLAVLRITRLTKEISAIYFAQEKPAVHPLDFSHITDRAELQQKLANLRSLRVKINKNPKRLEELPLLEAKINTVSQLLKSKTNDN